MSTGLIDPHYVTGTLSYVWPYLKVTLSLTAIAVFFGSLIGIFGAIGEIMGGRLTRKFIRAYVLVCRSLPNLVLLYLVYYGLPILLLAIHQEWGIHLPYEHISAYFVAAMGLALHTGAYLTEIFRAAIHSVNAGQVEAAKTLNMPWPVIFRRVILPQASVFAIPPWSGGPNSPLRPVEDGTKLQALPRPSPSGGGEVPPRFSLAAPGPGTPGIDARPDKVRERD